MFIVHVEREEVVIKKVERLNWEESNWEAMSWIECTKIISLP